MERWRGQALRILVGAAAIAALTASGAEAKGKLKAEIIRSKGGIPTIRADDFKGLGFGYGYAFAEDNICTIAEAYVTVERRALALLRPRRQTRPTATRTCRATSSTSGSRTRGIIDERARRAAAGRPEEEGRPGGQGLRRRLQPLPRQDRGRRTSPIRPAPAQPWVRDITTADVWRRFYQLGQLASGAGRRGRDRRRRRRAAPAARAPRRARRRQGDVADARRGARRRPRRHRLQRLGARQRGDRERQRHGARQPALPLAGLASASTSRTWWSRARSTSPAPASSACR